MRAQSETHDQRSPGEKNACIAEVHRGNLFPDELPAHPENLSEGFDGVTRSEQNPHQALAAVAAKRISSECEPS
jgi:hypothetical protein